MNILELKTFKDYIQVWIESADISNESYWFMLSNFLHKLKTLTDTKELIDTFKDEPFTEKDTGVPRVLQAMSAGVADAISFEKNITEPLWSKKSIYFLVDPYFSMKAKGDLRLVLLHESPPAFRVRNIFISRNSLSVA